MKTSVLYCFISSFVLIMLFFSCKKEEISENQTLNSLNANPNYVSVAEALAAGIKHFELLKVDTSNLLKSTNTWPDFHDKKVKEIKTFKEQDEDLFYLIKYENGGFIIISADKRVTPVLAYSDNNTFGDDKLPGISDWISATKEGILLAKKELKEPRKEESKLWEIYTGIKDINLKSEPADDPCSDCNGTWNFSTIRYVDTVARWGQESQYSYFSPNDDGCNCNRKPTGCGPVAMAMIMNYYHFPNGTLSFNGESLMTNYPMPRTLTAFCDYSSDPNIRQVPLLIRLCGANSTTGYGVLGTCNTWTYPGSINNAFESMGYANGGTWGSLSDKYQSVKDDLANGHPVIFSGTVNIVNSQDAHIWVGDGYSSLGGEFGATFINEYGETQCTCITYSTDKIGMNWGHNGYSNGFYLANYSFTDTHNSCTYDTYLRALTGIRP